MSRPRRFVINYVALKGNVFFSGVMILFSTAYTDDLFLQGELP